MIASRSLSLLAFSFASLALPATAQSEDFQKAVEALDRGNAEEALGHLQAVLATDPSNEAAYELWVNTEHTVWLKLLIKGGEIELVAKELVERAQMGRKQRQNNPDAIRELVKELASEDALVRNRVTNQLASDFGEYAVPILIYSLADQQNSDRRVNVIGALAKMGSDVVPPLCEALLDAPDAFLRKNIAHTLGYIKDPRSRAPLADAATNDGDSGVKTAAAQSLAKLGGGGDVGALFLALGDDYYSESDSVLMPHQYSDVVWHWEGNGLASTETPRFLYAPEMAKKSYYRALARLSDPGKALSGIARCAVTEIGRLAEWKSAGQDVGGWEARLQSDDLAAQMAGPEALDVALGWALKQGDMVAASGLCRLLASTGKTTSANLKSALNASTSMSVQGEAAVALGRIAYRNREAASAETVAALTTAAGHEVLRIGAIIGGDEASGRALAAQLGQHGYSASFWANGARGLASLRSLPGVDLIVVSENNLGDLTARQVINDLRRDPRTSKTPIYVRVGSADADQGLFGEVNGLIGPSDDIAATAEAASKEPLNRDREEALMLAARAASTLHALAAGKSEVGGSAEALAATLADRPDEVVVPALGALQFVGGGAHVERIAAVLSSSERSEAARVAAADALAGVFSRSGTTDAGILRVLQEVAQKDGSFAVRAATAGALGRLNLDRNVRVELMHGLLGR
jgi:HEAT repeat protein